jgi:hypothetical protein
MTSSRQVPHSLAGFNMEHVIVSIVIGLFILVVMIIAYRS